MFKNTTILIFCLVALLACNNSPNNTNSKGNPSPSSFPIKDTENATDTSTWSAHRRGYFSSDTIEDTNEAHTFVWHAIDTLPEFQQLVKRSNSDVNASILQPSDPDSTSNYYRVQVGFNSPEIFQTVYNFYVTPDLRRIFYLDTQKDTLITLQHWRKTRGW